MSLDPLEDQLDRIEPQPPGALILSDQDDEHGIVALDHVQGAQGLETAGTPILAVQVQRGPDGAVMLEQLDGFRSEMLRFMEDFDAILCPPDCHAALPHGAAEDYDKHRVWGHLYAYNLTGWPAGVVPAGVTGEGLPFGLQVVARPWREDVVLAVAAALESDLGGYRRPAL